MKQITDIQDPRLVKALAHPLRVRILAILEAKTASPTEIADELSMPLTNVSYHVRTLADFGLIRLVRRTPRRGAIEHHYEAVGRLSITDDAWAQVPDVVKEALVGATLMQIAEYVNSAVAEGGFNAPEAVMTRTPLQLDDRGWRELSSAVAKLSKTAQQIQRESSKRLREADHAGERSTGLVMMLFEADDFGNAVAEPDSAGPKRPSRRTRETAAPTG